jgi:hypothetical protein
MNPYESPNNVKEHVTARNRSVRRMATAAVIVTIGAMLIYTWLAANSGSNNPVQTLPTPNHLSDAYEP